jgi:hypothetical protein
MREKKIKDQIRTQHVIELTIPTSLGLPTSNNRGWAET